MRRIGTLSLVAVAVLLAGLALTIRTGPATVLRSALGALDAVAPRALAQTTLEFKQVPRESVTVLEREARDRADRAPAAPPAVPDVPRGPEAAPIEPVPPVPPVTRAGDMARFGNDIHVETGEVVRGDITAMGGTITVDGTVHGDIAAIGGDVYLNATARVEGDVVSVGGTVHERPGAYVSGKTMTVMGSGPEVTKRTRVHRWAEEHTERSASRIAGALSSLLVWICLALLVVWLFSTRVVSGVETVRRNPGLSLGIGALVYALLVPSVVALAVVVALLAITIIGIPLAMAAVLGYCLFFVVFLLFGVTIGAALVGGWIARKRGIAGLPLWQTVLAGVLLAGGARVVGRMLQAVPGLGWLGGLLLVATMLVGIVLATMGGGAWLKWEFAEGLFGRWRGRWENRRRPPTPETPYGPPPGSPYGPAAAPSTPPAPPATSTPEAFMPPTPEPPPSPPTSGA